MEAFLFRVSGRDHEGAFRDSGLRGVGLSAAG